MLCATPEGYEDVFAEDIGQRTVRTKLRLCLVTTFVVDGVTVRVSCSESCNEVDKTMAKFRRLQVRFVYESVSFSMVV